MKKLVGLAAIAILFSLTINAQQKSKNVKERAPMTSEQQATLQSKKMALHLDLDQDQQAAIYNLMKKNADERQSKREEFRKKRQEGVALSNEDRFQIQNERLDNQMAQKEAMKNILSKEQFDTWEKATIAKKRTARKKMRKSNNFKQKRNHRDMQRDRQHRQEREN